MEDNTRFLMQTWLNLREHGAKKLLGVHYRDVIYAVDARGDFSYRWEAEELFLCLRGEDICKRECIVSPPPDSKDILEYLLASITEGAWQCLS
jgi:hypothetical protein